MGRRSEVSTSVMKWSEGLGIRVSIIRRYKNLMNFANYMATSFIIILSYILVLFCINVYIVVYFLGFCLNFVNYVLLLLYLFMHSCFYACSVPGILFHCVVLYIVFV
jgi:hypothetical protein